MNHRAAITLTAAAVLTGTAVAAVVVPALAADLVGHAPASTTTAQAALSSTNALSPEQAAVLDDPQVTVHNDPDKARAAAIAAGRPEAAWDKDCVAWNLPEPEGDDMSKPGPTNWLARGWNRMRPAARTQSCSRTTTWRPSPKAARANWS